MATIIHKMKKGRPYYYAVESARVNGKPRIVWQKYLGTVDAIVARTEGSKPPKPKEAVLFEAGGSAALQGIAERLDLMKLINAAVPKREQGPSVGHYMALAALNRALAPCSKVEIGDWYEQTVLRRLWRFEKAAFTSQRFWDHMSMVSPASIEEIQTALVPRIRQEFGLDAEVLLYDTTNFFTFLSTVNDRCPLAQRGHSKAKRHDLRQVGLALLVTRDFQVPLFHRVYEGNIPDVSLFPALAQELIARHRQMDAQGRATLVFDKGNVSEDAMEQLVLANQPFIAAVPLSRLPELAATPLEQFSEVAGHPGTQAFAAPAEAWGKSCRAVLAYTESFFTQQLAGVTHNLVKCQKKLLDLEKNLLKWREGKMRGKKPTVRQVQASVRGILSAQFMADLFDVSVTEEEQGLPKLHYGVDHAALDSLTHKHLGRTLLLAVGTQGDAQQTIATYRSLTQIEEAFKNMKNVDFLRWQPAYHWTEQKLKVHGFYCVLALLLATLARKVAYQASIDLTLPALLEELTAIREVAVIYPQGTLTHPKDHITLSRMSPRQRKLADALNVAQVLKG
jgi:transposase